jgi:hypothetical protein
MTEFDDQLSPRGRERRRDILRVALAAAKRRRVGRRAARVGGGAVAVIVLLGVGVYLMRPATHDGPVQYVAVPRPPAATTRDAARFVTVETDPTIISRLSINLGPPRWATMSDDELLSSLASDGHPAGLIEVDGEMILVSSAAAPQP